MLSRRSGGLPQVLRGGWTAPRRHLAIAYLAAFALALAFGVCPRSLSAHQILYGDFMGTQVTFLGVTEESNLNPNPLPLFGSPANAGNLPGGYPPCTLGDNCTITGNSLFFSPLTFDAMSTNQVPPIDSVDGHLRFDAESKPGQTIQNISFFEAGAFLVSGFAGSNTDDTSVEVNLVGNVTVLEIDGDSNIMPLVIPITMSFVFDTGPGGQNLVTNQWRYLSEGDDSGTWNGSDFVDITQALIDAGRSFDQGATRINVNFDNILRAKSELLGTALIDKKTHLIVTVNVPEPASLALVLIAFVAIFGLVRRPQR
jgi:hypothetical protein